MKNFQLRNDLERVVIDGFALPLGFAPPPGSLQPPMQGYTVAYTSGQEDDPDTYSFHVVVSHEKLRPIVRWAIGLLPPEVFAIVEIGSRDAYRSTDTYLSEQPLTRREFLAVWDRYERFLLEDGAIAAGANSEEPFIEIFIDQWKGLSIHAPLTMRETVEAKLRDFGLEEVPQTWPSEDQESVEGGAAGQLDIDDDPARNSPLRSVLDLSDPFMPDVDELLLNLRHEWRMQLNIDPDSNVDESGRSLGPTLWHAVVIVDSAKDAPAASANGHGREPGHRMQDEADLPGPEQGGYASVWATAASLAEMERLIDEAIVKQPDWLFGEIYTIDRVAYDERPDELADLPPSCRSPQVHLFSIEPWGPASDEDSDSDDPG